MSMVGAVTVVIAIWVVIIVALAIWFFAARSRTQRLDEQHGHESLPSAPASTSRVPTAPTQVGPRSGFGAEVTRNAESEPEIFRELDADRVFGGGSGASGLGFDTSHDETRPVQPLASRPAAPVAPHAPQGQDRSTDEPFGLTTQEEYERLAAESFLAPPAVALGETGSRQPFSWEDAARDIDPTSPESQPIALPAAPQVRFDPAPSAPLVAPPVAPVRPGSEESEYGDVEPADDLDRTIMVAPEPAFDWDLILPDGARLPLDPDTVVGRRPVAIDGSSVLQIVDPTRTLSKSHARLRFLESRWWVTDLDSTNGLWLLHADGREEALAPYREVEAVPRLRLGTLVVELRVGFA